MKRPRWQRIVKKKLKGIYEATLNIGMAEQKRKKERERILQLTVTVVVSVG